MKDGTPLHQIVTVNARFSRSVSLTRDFEIGNALDGYILTPIGRDLLGRLQSALHGTSMTRAWSITGAYGSGKSAFALCVAHLLAGEPKSREFARDYLKKNDAKLWSAPVRSAEPPRSPLKTAIPSTCDWQQAASRQGDRRCARPGTATRRLEEARHETQRDREGGTCCDQ